MGNRLQTRSMGVVTVSKLALGGNSVRIEVQLGTEPGNSGHGPAGRGHVWGAYRRLRYTEDKAFILSHLAVVARIYAGE
jgi:hypothetical protein